MQHLYAPWRAKYLGSKSEECPFCVAGNLGVEDKNSSAVGENSGVSNENSSVLSENSGISCENSGISNENSNVADENSATLNENSIKANESISNAGKNGVKGENSNKASENSATSNKATKNSSILNENSSQTQKDSELGVIFRAKSCFGIMNLYPYSPGHFMVVPYAHEEQITSLPLGTWQEMSFFVREGVGILQKTLGAKGVNVGMNLGAPAGAGIAAHCHYHLVPRWAGDTNFITTIAHTRVCGRDLNEIYERLKVEFKGVCAKNS